MITKEELIELTRISHLKPYQQEKHYIQTIILNSIYSTIGNSLVFKGGTCLSFFYGLNRFSEDLDFTEIGEFDVEKVIFNLKKDLENLGINFKMGKIEEFENSVSFKVGVEGPLFSKEIERCFVSVEISKREVVFSYGAKELKTNYRDFLGFNVIVMEEREILAEKVRALITRNKARDLYDLHFLLKKDVEIDIDLINEKLKYYNKSFSFSEFKKSLDKKERIWKNELNPFIFGEIPDFSGVKRDVLKLLEGLKNKK